MFNKNILTTAICATALLGGTYSATSTAVTGTGTATAIVIAPLTIIESVGMDFGTVTPGTLGGTVTIDPAGAVALGGDATQTGASVPFSFFITGEAATPYTISYGAGTLTDGGPNNMTITPDSNNSVGAIPVGGTETFQVGATLAVSAGQFAGTYTEAGGVPFSVTINY